MYRNIPNHGVTLNFSGLGGQRDVEIRRIEMSSTTKPQFVLLEDDPE